MYEVYKISNRINNKVYIGITSIGIKERWYAHISCSRHTDNYNNPMYKDMIEFGVENFFIELLESNISKDDRDEREMFYIQKFNSKYPNGYNMTDGGFNNSGVIWSSERGRKISLSQKGKLKSSEHRKHLSESRLGKFKGKENAFYGKHHTSESRKLVSIANSKCPIQMINTFGNVIKEFYNINEGGRYVISLGLSKAKALTCSSRIREVCVQNEDGLRCKAYGYYWRFVKV